MFLQRFAIVNAELFDGSGAPPRRADAVVENGKIRAVAPAGELNLAGVPRTDAAGLALAPGFIDAHSHSDATLMLYPESESRITQGFTTEVVGQCGDADFICSGPERRERLERENGARVVWHDLESYMAELARRAPAVNVAALAGHGAIREEILGMSDRAPSPAELRRMEELLDTALRQGAAGLSSGLVYLPGRYAETPELAALAARLRGTGKLYATHLRSEGSGILPALREAAEIARAADGRLVVSHLKTMGRENWPKIRAALDEIDAMRRSGLSVTSDRYPYLHAATGLRNVLPEPYCSVADLREFLSAPERRREVAAALENAEARRKLPAEWEGILFTGARVEPEHLALRGLSLAEIARRFGVSPAEACTELLATEPNPRTQLRCMCEENLDRILSLDFVAAGSDSSGVPLDPSGPLTHPRAFGTAARFFRRVSRLASPAEAVRRMTSLPAAVHRLAGRGLVKEGYAADLVLFDPEKFDAPADYRDPRRPAVGVRTVWVNGEIAFDAEDPKRRGRAGVFLPVR